MDQFMVSGEGRVRETSVQKSIQRLKDMFPDLDATAWEAQVMLERTHRLLGNLRDAHWTKYGLTGRRFILLRLLYTTPGKRLSMREIAAHMNLAPNNVTQLIDGLERDGHVRREADAADKRMINAVLTEQGETLFIEVFPETATRIAGAWSDLSEQEKQLLSHLLARLRMHLLTQDARLRDVDFAAATNPASRKPGK
jgi:MarR family 2-MHQ and catechol resistance regulon transcriptional repressor